MSDISCKKLFTSTFGPNLFALLQGKDQGTDPEKGLAHNVVLSGLENKGYHVFTDNFYSSPILSSELYDSGFEACGTVRIDRKGIPSHSSWLMYPKV